MAVRTGQAQWKGDLFKGTGTMSVESGAFEGAYSFGSRFEAAGGTNPEELIAAAHAGCFSMALSAGLAGAGFTPEDVSTMSKVQVEKVDDGFAITNIELTCTAKVPGIDDATFQKFAEETKTGCPVSKALSSVPMHLKATLIKE